MVFTIRVPWNLKHPYSIAAIGIKFWTDSHNSAHKWPKKRYNKNVVDAKIYNNNNIVRKHQTMTIFFPGIWLSCTTLWPKLKEWMSYSVCLESELLLDILKPQLYSKHRHIMISNCKSSRKNHSKQKCSPNTTVKYNLVTSQRCKSHFTKKTPYSTCRRCKTNGHVMLVPAYYGIFLGTTTPIEVHDA